VTCLEFGHEQRQVVLPVRLPGTERIGQTQIAGTENENLRGVSDLVTAPSFPVGRHGPTNCERKSECRLDAVHRLHVTPQSDEPGVEAGEPFAHPLRRVPLRVCADEHDLDPIPGFPRKFTQDGGDARHVDRTDVRAVRVPEKEKGQLALRLLAEAERLSVHVGEREVGARPGLQSHATVSWRGVSPRRATVALGGPRGLAPCVARDKGQEESGGSQRERT
jgi:hypothetical protein